MSKLSFVSFCIEYYAEHTGRSSENVYRLFAEEKVIEMLENDYEDLHGMSMEYLMQFIDAYLGEKVNPRMSHATIRATLLPDIVRLIAEKYNCSDFDALDKFYTSATGANFADDETGLYGQSALYIFSLFEKEFDN